MEKDSLGKVLQWGILERSGRVFHSTIQPMRPDDVSPLLERLLAEMFVQSREVVMSVAPFYVFTVVSDTIDPALIPARPGAYKIQGVYLKDGRYFFGAIPRDVEKAYREVARLVGLRLIRLELASFALADQFQEKRGKILIVDSDHRCTTYTEIKDGVISYIFRTDLGSDSGVADGAPHITPYVWGVIMNTAKEIAATRGIDQLILSNSVFNIANGLQKVSQQITDRYR